jgi:hypothetical protein
MTTADDRTALEGVARELKSALLLYREVFVSCGFPTMGLISMFESVQRVVNAVDEHLRATEDPTPVCREAPMPPAPERFELHEVAAGDRSCLVWRGDDGLWHAERRLAGRTVGSVVDSGWRRSDAVAHACAWVNAGGAT